MRDLVPQAAALVGTGLLFATVLLTAPAEGLPPAPEGVGGTYRNPVLFADYSDPDVIRVGGDFYLVSSSFSSVPGLPILHSSDLVTWTIVGHAAARLPSPEFDTPRHGQGMWAPSLRHHAGRFWIYVGDPDRGIYLTTARDPRGPWTPLTLVKEAKGAIDPCPLWDDDGKMYLVHAWAKSRAGFNSILTVTPLTSDGLRPAGADVQVFDGRVNHPTIEGPKFHKRDGYYYIFAPAGGVATGWQTVLRSRNLLGPYEDRIVLRQGRTGVNGPHQGAWVETAMGESWFLHFQDRGAYGRVVHLQPMEWKSGWPVIGADPDGDGTGEPVAAFRRPVGKSLVKSGEPKTSDEFESRALGLQWQWNANPTAAWHSLDRRGGWLRLHTVARPVGVPSLFGLSHLLLQKFPAEEFQATVRIDASALAIGESAGLVIAGRDTASISVVRQGSGLAVGPSLGKDVDKDGADRPGPLMPIASAAVFLRATIVRPGAEASLEAGPEARFSYSLDGFRFAEVGELFRVRPGVWVGARIGLFASGPSAPGAARGRADVDWFRVEPLPPVVTPVPALEYL